jgi:hypothetical protein
VRSRSRFEDILDVLQTIRAAEDPAAAPRDLRLKAMQSVAAREFAPRDRFRNQESAYRSIRDACTRRFLRLSMPEFDNRIAAWLAGNPEELYSVLRKIDGYDDNRIAVEALLGAPLRSGTPSKGSQAVNWKRGTADVLSRLEVERAAIECVAEHFRQLGYTVTSVEADRVGWDLEAKIDGQPVLFLEVKGLSSDVPRAELTPNEYEKMEAHKASYRICLVVNARVKPIIREFCWKGQRSGWVDDGGSRLTIKPRMGAVVSVDLPRRFRRTAPRSGHHE